MDRRFLTVVGISLLFALVISTLFYSLTSRAAGRPRSQKKVEMTTVATAARALSVGMEIKPADVKLVSIPRDRFPKGGFERVEQVVGRPVISNILLDEPVMEGRLAERGSGFGLAPMIPTGMRAVAVKVNEVIGVAGFLISGMRVDVLVTMRPAGEGGSARTNTVLQNIVVASAGQQIQPDATGKAVNVPVVTLLVTPEQAEALTLAGNEGRIQLVLRNSGDQAMAKTRGSEIGDLYAPNRPVPAPVWRAASPKAPVAAPVAAVVLPPPPDEVLVIRGSQASVEQVGAGRPK
jgi:pilus assembly protein CpaB